MKRALLIVLALTACAIVAGPSGVAAAKRSGHGSGTSRPALKIDRNRDGIPDRWERRYRLSTRADVSLNDPDEDGLNNLEEYNGDTDPRNPDSDDNGVLDGDEDGVVLSYNEVTGMLRVLMPGGHRIRGFVDEDTMVFCEPDTSNADSGTDGSYSVGGNTDVAPVDPGASDPALFDDECGLENVLPGAKVLYVDTDGGYFTDITLDEHPLPVDGGN